MKWIASAACALLLTGCVSYRSHGTRHYVILGFGIVSVNDTNKNMANVVRGRALGFSACGGPGANATVGFASFTSVAIKTNAPLLIEIKASPLGAVKVNVNK